MSSLQIVSGLEVAIASSALALTFKSDGRACRAVSVPLWSHTVFELENVSAALRCFGDGTLPTFWDVPRPNALAGGKVGLRCATSCELGRASLRTPTAETVNLICSREWTRVREPKIEVVAMLGGDGLVQMVSIAEAIGLSRALHTMAERVSAILAGAGGAL